MPDLSALQALDVAIGLAFLYFMLSIVCSSITEMIAAIFRMRAKNLETGIRTLLGSKQASDAFFAEWRIKSLGTPKWFSRDKNETSRRPSYIPSRTFALAVLDTLAPDAAKASVANASQPPSSDLVQAMRNQIATIQSEPVKRRLTAAMDRASEGMGAVRRELEDSFNEVMDRATGWYKRKTQIVIFLVGLAVAGGVNADTLNVADRLARDDALRARVVAEAQRAAETKSDEELDRTPTAADVEKQIAQARATSLPLGWGAENAPESDPLGILGKVGGILITAFALTLGAPFWFDVLGKFARLRSSGNRIGTPKDDETAPVDRDDRLRRAAPAGSAPPPPLAP
jgi:hypothetical protein